MPRVARAAVVAQAVVGAKRDAEEVSEGDRARAWTPAPAPALWTVQHCALGSIVDCCASCLHVLTRACVLVRARVCVCVQQQQRTDDDDDDDDDSSDEEVPAAPMHGPTPVQRLVVGTQLCLLQPEHVAIKAFQTPRFAPLRALVHGLVATPDAVGWSQQRVVQLPSAGIGKPQLSIWAKKLDDATLRFRFDDSRSSTGFGIDALIRKLGTVSAASEGLTRVHVSEFLQGGFFYATRCSDGFQVKLLLDREHEDRTWKRKTLLARPKRPPSHKPPSPAPVPPPPAAAPPSPPVPPPPHPPTQPATPQSTPEAATVSQTTPMALDARLETLLAQFDERVDRSTRTLYSSATRRLGQNRPAPTECAGERPAAAAVQAAVARRDPCRDGSRGSRRRSTSRSSRAPTRRQRWR